nr:MAG TPA: cellulase [Caudoviricetes sp.]
MKKSFITVSPDSGQNDNVLNIVCDKTTLSMERTEVLNVAGEGGISKTIDIFQSGVLYPIIDLGFIIDGTISGMDFEKRYTESSKTLESVFNYPKTALLLSNYTYFGVFNLGAFKPEVVITTGWFIDTIEITVVGNSPKTFTYTSNGSTFTNDDFTGGQLVYSNPYNYNLVKTMMNDIRSLGGEIIVTMKSSTLDPTICICDCIINS